MDDQGAGLDAGTGRAQAVRGRGDDDARAMPATPAAAIGAHAPVRAWAGRGARAFPLAAALLGWIAGTAGHLQLAQLPSTAWLVAACIGAAVPWIAGLRLRAARGSAVVTPALVALALAALAFGLCGLRAAQRAGTALDPALEGRDLVVEGVVAAMPQRAAQGTRLRLDVERAWLAGDAVRLPPRIALGWWSQDGDAGAPAIRAGERWRLPVRLKAPHGLVNPHGFDAELWMWEQGLQASGSIRASGAAGPPERLSTTGWRPVERARQAVRDAILARVDDARAAGVVAALVTGDQNAIAQGDWEVFRATGVAHLMSISGM